MRHASFLAGCALAAILASGAQAGGLAVTLDSVPAPAAGVAPAQDWTGGYAGGSVGTIFAADDRVGVTDPGGALISTPGSVDITGLSWGLHAGYRWQRGAGAWQVVYGPEFSIQKSNAREAFDNGSLASESQMDRFTALRFKAGVLTASGHTLFYGQTGVARGTFDYLVEGAGMSHDGDYSDDAWLLGAGVERRVSRHWSIVGEYEYRGFDKVRLTDENGFRTDATPDHHSLKLGLNFNF